MRISDWSSDVCSSDLGDGAGRPRRRAQLRQADCRRPGPGSDAKQRSGQRLPGDTPCLKSTISPSTTARRRGSEEHTSELQSLMRISYAVFCLKKKNEKKTQM